MYGPRYELLSGSTLPGNKNCAVGTGHRLDLFIELVHLGAITDHRIHAVLVTECSLKMGDFFLQSTPLQRQVSTRIRSAT